MKFVYVVGALLALWFLVAPLAVGVAMWWSGPDTPTKPPGDNGT